jgi:putative alpha-1,2-mannosidase
MNSRNLMLLLVLLGASGLNVRAEAAAAEQLQRVDPFIGTGFHGHTFPGATTPFGMVQLSPDTRTSGWDACGGYYDADTEIWGFSHTHLNGTGIGDYGDVLMMPFAGDIGIGSGTPEKPDYGYRSAFNKKNQFATPGYYRVLLDRFQI